MCCRRTQQDVHGGTVLHVLLTLCLVDFEFEFLLVHHGLSRLAFCITNDRAGQQAFSTARLIVWIYKTENSILFWLPVELMKL